MPYTYRNTALSITYTDTRPLAEGYEGVRMSAFAVVLREAVRVEQERLRVDLVIMVDCICGNVDSNTFAYHHISVRDLVRLFANSCQKRKGCVQA